MKAISTNANLQPKSEKISDINKIIKHKSNLHS